MQYEALLIGTTLVYAHSQANGPAIFNLRWQSLARQMCKAGAIPGADRHYAQA